MQLVNINQSVFFDLRGSSLSQFVQHRFTEALMFREGALAQAEHHQCTHDTCVALTCSSNFPSAGTLSSLELILPKN